MTRVQIDIEFKAMIKEISTALGGKLKSQDVVQMCIQSVHDNIVDGKLLELSDINPTQLKLDRIIEMLEEVMPEI